MPWLVRDGEVLATLEVASTFGERLRGLLGRDGIDGALLIEGARSVHTLGMRFPIDVAYLDATMTVFETAQMRTWRPGRPRLRARWVARTGVSVEGGGTYLVGQEPGANRKLQPFRLDLGPRNYSKLGQHLLPAA